MKHLHIPDVGEEFVLARPWSFTLYNEYRNTDVRDALGLNLVPEFVALETPAPFETWEQRYARQDKLRDMMWSVTLPPGTKLLIDRIYIRKGAADYSSLSFYVTECPLQALTPTKKGGGFKKGRRRFWAKLADVNNIVYVGE